MLSKVSLLKSNANTDEEILFKLNRFFELIAFDALILINKFLKRILDYEN